MIERKFGNNNFRVDSQREVITDAGKIVEFKLLSNGATHTVYSQINSTFGLDVLLEEIEKNKAGLENPFLGERIKIVSCKNK